MNIYGLLCCLGLLILGVRSHNRRKVKNDGNGNVFRLQLLHTNDMHSYFSQYDKSGMQCTKECIGGFPRLKTAVDQEVRKAKKDPNVDGTLFLNAGDTFQGTVFFTLFKWEIVAALLPKIGIDVMVSVLNFFFPPPESRSSYGK